jgi:hypothetical protein
MGELKPLGSEKLNGDEKLKRILELTYYNNPTSNSNSKKSEFVTESKIGGVYGIVKEKDGYYVKRGLNESSLDYIGGMFMKNKNKFNSYSEALKRLQLIKSQEELQEATKYVLKNKPKEESPAPDMGGDLPLPPADGGGEGDLPLPPADGGGEGDLPLPPADGGGEGDLPLPPADGGGESMDSGKRSDYMAEAQKYAGKLGQELRDLKERMESDDIKYILNMIISAVDLDKLDDEDIEEIGKKFERDEVEGDEFGSDEVPLPDSESPEEDLGEVDGIESLESFVNSSIGDTNEINLEDYADLSDLEETSHNEIKELDLDEIKKEINDTIGKTLSKYFN